MENYESFNYAHSTYKLDKGGKGIGRFAWLRAFRKVEIESVYKSNGCFMKRTFNFEPTRDGIENHDNTLFECKNYNRYTKIHLKSLKKDYQKWCNYKLEDLAWKIIEHCFTYFLEDDCPKIILKDSNDKVNVNELFERYTRHAIHSEEIEIKGNKFNLDIVKLYSPKPDNKIHLRAHKRDVISEPIDNYIPELQKYIEDENGGKFSGTIEVCVGRGLGYRRRIGQLL